MNKMNYKKISELTEINNHTEARIKVAKELLKKTKNDDYLEILKAIKKIQNIERHLPFHLMNYRIEVTNKMMIAVENVFGKEVYEQLNKCL